MKTNATRQQLEDLREQFLKDKASTDGATRQRAHYPIQKLLMANYAGVLDDLIELADYEETFDGEFVGNEEPSCDGCECCSNCPGHNNVEEDPTESFDRRQPTILERLFRKAK